jgi:hypothetical protein
MLTHRDVPISGASRVVRAKDGAEICMFPLKYAVHNIRPSKPKGTKIYIVECDDTNTYPDDRIFGTQYKTKEAHLGSKGYSINNLKTLTMLVEAGAQVTYEHEAIPGRPLCPALDFYFKHNNAECIDYLLKQGVPLELLSLQFENLGLPGKLPILKALIENGLDLERPATWGEGTIRDSIQAFARQRGAYETYEYLCEE